MCPQSKGTEDCWGSPEAGRGRKDPPPPEPSEGFGGDIGCVARQPAAPVQTEAPSNLAGRGHHWHSLGGLGHGLTRAQLTGTPAGSLRGGPCLLLSPSTPQVRVSERGLLLPRAGVCVGGGGHLTHPRRLCTDSDHLSASCEGPLFKRQNNDCPTHTT